MRVDLLIIAGSMMLAAASAGVAVAILIMKKPEWRLWRPRAAARQAAPPATTDPAGIQNTAPRQEGSERTRPRLDAGEGEWPMDPSLALPSWVRDADDGEDDEESETPEAALTMNLINKKRDAKKETMRELMRRLHRRENPRQIAEALHVGVGEVALAAALAKLKK